MGIFDKVKKTTIASRQREEILYGVALEEVENNEIRKGLYAKALSKADGDKEKADGNFNPTSGDFSRSVNTGPTPWIRFLMNYQGRGERH